MSNSGDSRRQVPLYVMPAGAGSVPIRYAFAVVLTAVAFVIWRAIGSVFGPDPFLVLLVAVAVGTWFGGLGPGLVAMICGMAGTVYATPQTALPYLPVSTHQAAELTICTLVAFAISWPNGMMNRVQDRVLNRLEFGSDVTSAIGDAVCVLDQEGRITYANPAAEDLLGWSGSDLRGKDMHEMLHVCHRRNGARLIPEECPLRLIAHGGSPFRTEDDQFRRRDRSVLPVAFSLSPIIKSGKPRGSVLTFRDVSERQHSVGLLRDSEKQYRSMLDTSPDSIVVADLYSYVIMANQRAAELYGYASPAEMLGVSVLEMVAPEDRVRAARDKRTTIEDGGMRDIEYLALRRDGTNFTAEVSASLITDAEGKPCALMAAARDRTVHKQAEAAVRQGEAAAALQYAATAILAESAGLGDAIPKLLQTIAKGSGWDTGLFWGVNRGRTEMRCRFVWRVPKVDIDEFDLLSRQMTFIPGIGLPGRVWASGETLWVRDVVQEPAYTRALSATKVGLHTAFCVPIRIEGAVQAVMEFYSREIRPPNQELIEMMTSLSRHIGQFIKRRQAEEALEHAAYHDPLTDLANRLLFNRRMDRAILASWSESKALTILLLDLNKFKQVNDTHGHHCGDQILLQTAIRLRRSLRDSDTVARLGGDEFAILLAGTDVAGAKVVARKLVQAIAEPVHFDGQKLQVGASIGLAIYPLHGEDTKTLLQRADAAMYASKRSGGGFAVYEQAHDDLMHERAN